MVIKFLHFRNSSFYTELQNLNVSPSKLSTIIYGTYVLLLGDIYTISVYTLTRVHIPGILNLLICTVCNIIIALEIMEYLCSAFFPIASVVVLSTFYPKEPVPASFDVRYDLL